MINTLRETEAEREERAMRGWLGVWQKEGMKGEVNEDKRERRLESTWDGGCCFVL